MYWEPELETMEEADLSRLQLSRLNETLARAARAPFQRRRLEEAGIGREGLKDLSETARLPLTAKDDLRAGFPYELLAVDLEEVVRVHVSSGTTGTPTAIYHTASDLAAWANLVARCLFMVGLRPRDIFQNMVGYGLFSGGLGLHYGAERLGALVIPSGVGNSRRQISLLRQFKTTAAHIIPSYALKLLDSFRAQGLDPRKDTSLTRFIVGAEPHTEEARARIEEAYGVEAFNCYGLSEMNGPGVAFECPRKTGLHIWEDAYLVEILDPATHQPVEPGVRGELVLTTLTRRAMPLIRYRTGDLTTLLPGSCPCGRTHRRLARVAGRADDMFIIKGVNIYPMQVESVLLGFPELGNNYQIELSKDGPVDAMLVNVEVSEKARTLSAREMEGLGKKLVQALRDEILIRPEVRLVAPQSLPAGEGKAVRVVDKRKEA